MMTSPLRIIKVLTLLCLVSKITRCEADYDVSKLYADVCGFPLSDDIVSSGFTASSSYNGYPPDEAQFNRDKLCWRAAVNDTFQWIQVDLPDEIPVTGILTQGMIDVDYYVTYYKVEHSLDGVHWQCILDQHGQIKIFNGNIDKYTPVIHHFRPAVTAHFIRLTPIKWYRAIAMHLEVFGGGCRECWEK